MWAIVLQMPENFSVCHLLQAYKTYKLGGKMSELLYSPATYGVDFSSKSMLRARQAPMMAVVRNTLWLLGGIVEVSFLRAHTHNSTAIPISFGPLLHIKSENKFYGH